VGAPQKAAFYLPTGLKGAVTVLPPGPVEHSLPVNLLVYFALKYGVFSAGFHSRNFYNATIAAMAFRVLESATPLPQKNRSAEDRTSEGESSL